MISGKYIIKKLLIFVFIQLLMVNFSFASSIPVLCVFKFIPCTNNINQSTKYYILESDYSTGKALKRYDLNSYYILESDYSTGKALKRYE